MSHIETHMSIIEALLLRLEATVKKIVSNPSNEIVVVDGDVESIASNHAPSVAPTLTCCKTDKVSLARRRTLL